MTLAKFVEIFLVTAFICFEKFDFISNVKPILNLKDRFEKRWKNIALLNLNIYCTWKNIKKISAPTWNDEFELPDGSHLISDI